MNPECDVEVGWDGTRSVPLNPDCHAETGLGTSC